MYASRSIRYDLHHMYCLAYESVNKAAARLLYARVMIEILLDKEESATRCHNPRSDSKVIGLPIRSMVLVHTTTVAFFS